MVYADAKSVDPGTIAVIDITPLRDGSDVNSVADALRAASQGLGFIYIKGHGISETCITAARNAAYDFFRSNEESKDQVKVSKNHRGWIGTGGAKMHDDAKPDLKESFLWGFEDEQGNTPDDHELRGENLWPDFQPNLKHIALDYFEKVHGVAHCLMRGFAIGLDLDENFFLKTSDQPLSRGSFVYYPSQGESLGKDQFGVAPHTDFGVLTVLCQDNVGGLQIETADGEWIEAPPIEGTLIVNVADLLHRWTDGAFKSTPHRVVNSSGRERLSIVLAFDPNPETIIDAKDIFGKSSEEPITCGEYLNWRFNKAFSYRKEAS